MVSEFPEVVPPDYRDYVTSIIELAVRAGWNLNPSSGPKSQRLKLNHPDTGAECGTISSDGKLWVNFGSKAGPSGDPSINDQLGQLLVDAAPEWSKHIRENPNYVGVPVRLFNTNERLLSLSKFLVLYKQVVDADSSA